MKFSIKNLLGTLNRDDLRHGFHYSIKFNALYVEVPKCACSSIKRRMQNYEQGVEDGTSLKVDDVHNKNQNPFSLPGLSLEGKSGLSDRKFAKVLTSRRVYRFSLVRNPYERLISGYKNKILKKNKARVHVVQGIHGKERYTPEEARQVDVSFEEFVDFIVSHEDPITLNPHWRPQVSMLLVDFIEYDFIGKLETIERDWAVIHNAIYPYDYIPLSQENRSGKRKVFNRLGYTAEIAEKVYNYYHRDFEFFGYSKDSFQREDRLDWRVKPSDLKLDSRSDGVSGFMRLRNEETYLDAAISSHLEFLDELVLVYNNCTDSTPEICKSWAEKRPDKIKVYSYDPYVFPVGARESTILPHSDERTLANFYNFALCKTSRKIAIKVDGDHIAVPEVFGKAVERARALRPDEWLSTRGANLFEYDGETFISNGYGNRIEPSDLRNGGAPPLTGGDHAFFCVDVNTWHEMDSREGYEILKLYEVKERGISFTPVAFLHLKGIKADKGMSNWELESYKDSIRQAWSRAVCHTKDAELLTVEECQTLYPSYFKAFPVGLLNDFGIHLTYAPASWFRRFRARLQRLFRDEEKNINH